MATNICARRLTKELKCLAKEPLESPKITVRPNESNILEMHFVIEGSEGTPYAGGFYHGKLLFPKEYPLKPPGVMICTPNGRFRPNCRLCLTMSDFHPESWNPLWSIGTIITGLYSFMVESGQTVGSIDTTDEQKRKFARQSLEYNVHDSMFAKLFPEYVEMHKERLAAKQAALGTSTADLSSEGSASFTVQDATAQMLGRNDQADLNGLFAIGAGVFAILAIAFSMMRFL